MNVRQEMYSGDLVADIYGGDRQGAIVIVSGYPDPGFEKAFGCKFKDQAWTVTWAKRIADAGLTAVTYTNREPERDLYAVLDYVRTNIGDRIGVLACSGHVPLALSLLTSEIPLRCAALLYGYSFDAEEQAKQFRFVYPLTGKSIDDLRPDVPLFLARAGGDDMPRLNSELDRFIAGAIARNLPLTIVNDPAGAHAFDLLDNGTTARIARQGITFMLGNV